MLLVGVSKSNEPIALSQRASLITFFAIILLIIVAALGYWIWYLTSAPSAFNSPGMDINNIVPRLLNAWGCDQLKKSFGSECASFGCTSDDFTSWK